MTTTTTDRQAELEARIASDQDRVADLTRMALHRRITRAQQDALEAPVIAQIDAARAELATLNELAEVLDGAW